MLALTLLAIVACTPLSTVPFDPGRKQNLEEQQAKQGNHPEIKSGMTCYEYCLAAGNCTASEEARKRLQAWGCKIYFGSDAQNFLRGR